MRTDLFCFGLIDCEPQQDKNKPKPGEDRRKLLRTAARRTSMALPVVWEGSFVPFGDLFEMSDNRLDGRLAA